MAWQPALKRRPRILWIRGPAVKNLLQFFPWTLQPGRFDGAANRRRL